MESYQRLSAAEQTLGAAQIWTNSESNFQSLVSATASGAATYTFNYGLFGIDIAATTSEFIAMEDQDVKMDSPKPIELKAICFPTATFAAVTASGQPASESLFAPSGLSYQRI